MQLGLNQGTPRLRRYSGRRWRWNGVLRRMDLNDDAYDEEAYADLCRLSEELERRVAGSGLRATPLDAWTQRMRGWLRYFARREHFDAYRVAVARARPSIAAAFRERWPVGYTWICFQPVRGLFGTQKKDNRFRLMLPTPMFTFDERAFELVAQVAFWGGRQNALRTATCTPEYQALQAELDALGAEGLARPITPVVDPAVMATAR